MKFDVAQNFILKSEDDTKKIAKKIAESLKFNSILAISGDLGSGKTFLCREIIKYLFGKETNVISPTFNLLQTYKNNSHSLYHFDLYRLKHISEIYELGIEEAFDNICLIEWPEIIKTILPKDTIHLKIAISECNIRHLSIK